MNYPAHSDAATHPASGDCLDGGLMLALLQTGRKVQERLESTLEAVGLSGAKYQALDALVRAGKPLALSELAGCLKCVRSNITQLTDRLETDGLVRRVDDPIDRRAIRAIVTPLGIERHAAGEQGLADLQSWLEMRVAPGERDALLRMLSAIEK